MTHSRQNSDATSTTLSDAPTCYVSLERPVLQVLLPWWICEEEDIRGEALRGPCLTTISLPGTPLILPWWSREEEDIRGEARRGPCLTTNRTPRSLLLLLPGLS